MVSVFGLENLQINYFVVILFGVLSVSSESVRRGSRVSAVVWSSYKGFDLKVDSCDSADCSIPLARQSFSLTPAKGRPHQPTQGEGVTLTVLNQRKANVVFHKVFPLHQYWVHYADLQWHMGRVAPGRIVVMTVSVSGAVGLREAAQQLQHLGSAFATYLTPWALWTWVFVKGGRTLSETLILQGATGHQTHTLLNLSDLPLPSSSSSLTEQRWHYCHYHGAMGGLCDEDTPDLLPPPTSPVIARQSALDHVPVVVTAGVRHQYLYYTLTTLLAAPGAQRSNVLVVLGDAPQSTIQLLRLTDVNFTRISVSGKDNFKLFHYYRNVFQLVARTFPDAPAAIFLDEDVQVSPDFFSFMSQTLWLLRADPTLYCINGHSATGLEDRAFNPSRVLRGGVQVEWGYAVTLDFIREALSVWPEDPTSIHIYDYWIYKHARKERECLYPEMSRTRHYGIGMNTGGLTVERVFLTMPVVREAHVDLVGVTHLRYKDWKDQLSYNISHAVALHGNPCSPDFLPQDDKIPNYVFFYRLDPLEDGIPDYTQFFHLCKCVGTWGISEQGQHEGVSIVTISTTITLYLVGVPYSSYSHLRPSDLQLWDVNAIPEEEFVIVEKNELQRHKFQPNIVNRNMTTDYLIDNILSMS